jgi:hypothetical protein
MLRMQQSTPVVDRGAGGDCPVGALGKCNQGVWGAFVAFEGDLSASRRDHFVGYPAAVANRGEAANLRGGRIEMTYAPKICG